VPGFEKVECLRGALAPLLKLIPPLLLVTPFANSFVMLKYGKSLGSEVTG